LLVIRPGKKFSTELEELLEGARQEHVGQTRKNRHL
jgi:hypothetical protein